MCQKETRKFIQYSEKIKLFYCGCLIFRHVHMIRTIKYDKKLQKGLKYGNSDEEGFLID